MASGKVIEFNVKTGETKVTTKDYIEIVRPPKDKGINFAKLKALLLSKGIITNLSEIE